MTVSIQPLLMSGSGQIKVLWNWQGEEIQIRLSPVIFDERTGFALDAAVWGEEYKTHQDTYIDKAVKSLQPIIGNPKKPFADFNKGQGIRSVSDLKAQDTGTTYLPIKGKPIQRDIPESTLNATQAALSIKRRLSRWEPEWMDEIRRAYPNGIPNGELEKLFEHFAAQGGHGECARSVG